MMPQIRLRGWLLFSTSFWKPLRPHSSPPATDGPKFTKDTSPTHMLKTRALQTWPTMTRRLSL
eukprot:11159234-Lingulodinium_polyedra.AAC.1